MDSRAANVTPDQSTVSDSDPIADFPRLGVFPERIDHAGDLVAGRTWIYDSWKLALFGHRVAMTDATGLNLDSDLRGGGLAQGLFD